MVSRCFVSRLEVLLSGSGDPSLDDIVFGGCFTDEWFFLGCGLISSSG